MAVTTVKAELGGTLIDALVYGLFLSVFVRAMQVLQRRKTYDSTSIALLSTTIVLFCLITAHLGLDIDRAFRAFTDNTSTPNYAKGYYNILSGAEALTKNSAYVTITLIADAFLIFRCWAAFGRNILMVLIPSGLYGANIGLACWALGTFKKAEDPTSGEVVVAEVISRVEFMYIITLALNLYCSLSIAIRIWYVQRQSSGTSGRLLQNTLTIVVESAALYSMFLIILITSAALENPLMYAVLNPMPSIVGFVFTSIILRVGSGKSFTTEKPTGGAGPGATTRSFIESVMRFGRPAGGHAESTFDLDLGHGGNTSILPTTASVRLPQNASESTSLNRTSSGGSDSIPKEKKT